MNIKKEVLKLIMTFLIKMSKVGLISDETYLRIVYKVKTKKKLNLKNPSTYNEKLQWLKLYDRKEIYTTMVDKYLVKNYVSKIIGNEFIIPTLGVYDDFNDIDFNRLPNKFVIKCNHDSGSIIICKDKNCFDIKKAKKKITKRMKKNFYDHFKEWPYKNVKPRIIIEKYMEDSTTHDLKDYKFFVFDGKVECIQVDYDRFINHKRSFYDVNWNRLPFTICYPTDYNVEIDRPNNFDKMLQTVKKLSSCIKDNKHVRIDIYSIDEKIYFGEFTFYHGSGFEKFDPEEWDYKLGELIKLPLDKS